MCLVIKHNEICNYKYKIFIKVKNMVKYIIMAHMTTGHCKAHHVSGTIFSLPIPSSTEDLNPFVIKTQNHNQ